MAHIDYFSFLPDPIISTIISHLPFKEAARTSVLSTRWRHLWQSTATIDLDETLFVRNQQSPEEKANQRLNFINFIRRWMQNYVEPSVERYRIKISNPAEALNEVQTCITFVNNHQEIKALDLDFSDSNLDALPHQPSLDVPVILDSHTMLQSLRLSACNTFQIPHQDCRFHSLKALYLGHMKMKGNSIITLLESCPSVENLILQRCWDMGQLPIESPSLRFLTIDKCSGIVEVDLNTPSLKYFRYCGLSISLETEDMPAIETVVLDYTHDPNWSDDDAENLRGFLRNVSGVRVLNICSYVLQVVPMYGGSTMWLTPSLASVKHLILKTRLNIQEYYGIALFMNSCPKLEVLSIELSQMPVFEDYEPPHEYDEHPFFNPLWYPMCLNDTLKAVKVKGFKGSPDERAVLSYILKLGKVLEYLDITFSDRKTSEDGVPMESVYRDNLRQLMQGIKVASTNLKIIVRK